MKAHVSACSYDCGDACSLLIEPRDNGGYSVRGNPDHPFTRGFICAKGKALADRLARADRITEPLLNRGGSFSSISWDAALDLAAERIAALRDEPERIAHIKGFAYRGVLAKASTFLFKSLGATGLRGSLCDEAGIEAMVACCGSLDMNTPELLTRAPRIVNWGRDLVRGSVHTAEIIRRARNGGTRVLLVSPAPDGMESLSDEIIMVPPGRDRFLAAAVIKLLLERGLPDRVHDAVANLDAIHRLLDGLSLAELVRRAGVAESVVRDIADWYAEPGETATLLAWGLQRHAFGHQTIRWIAALGMLSGNMGLESCGVYYNQSSNRYFKSPTASRGYSREMLLPRLAREIAHADPPIDLAWVDGGNPVNQVPAARRMADAFQAIPFTIVADAFMTDTAARADLVLPVALGPEREDLVGSFWHDQINYTPGLCPAPGQARSDFAIVAELAERLEVDFPDKNAWLEGALKPGAGLDLADLKERGFATATRNPVAFEGLRFDHPDGQFRLPESLSPEPAPHPDHPLRLLTLVNAGAIHSQIAPETMRGLPTAYVATGSPHLAGIDTCRPARLVSELGSLDVNVEERRSLHPDVVIVRRGGWLAKGWNANAIIAAETTDDGTVAAYYSQCVRLEQD